MGAILRLDGRIEVEEQQCDAVGVITRVVDGGACGRVWPIEAHRKPELRLKSWSKGRPLRADATSVVVGDGGELDYHDLAPGIYLARSSTSPRDPKHPAEVVFRVTDGRAAEVIARDATGPLGRDATVCALSGWSLDRLRAEREGYATDLAEKRAAEGFAPLVGTEGQVVWANEFRGVKVRHGIDHLTQREAELYAADPADPGHRKMFARCQWLAYALAELMKIEDASWWVARVSKPGADVLREFAAELRAASKAALSAELAGKGGGR